MKKKSNRCSFFCLVLDPNSRALPVSYSIRQAELQREVMAMKLELWVGEWENKWEWKKQQNEETVGTGDSLSRLFPLYRTSQYVCETWSCEISHRKIYLHLFTCVFVHVYFCSIWYFRNTTGTCVYANDAPRPQRFCSFSVLFYFFNNLSNSSAGCSCAGAICIINKIFNILEYIYFHQWTQYLMCVCYLTCFSAGIHLYLLIFVVVCVCVHSFLFQFVSTCSVHLCICLNKMRRSFNMFVCMWCKNWYSRRWSDCRYLILSLTSQLESGVHSLEENLSAHQNQPTHSKMFFSLFNFTDSSSTHPITNTYITAFSCKVNVLIFWAHILWANT